MGTDEVDQRNLKFSVEWKRMLKYRVAGPSKVDHDSHQMSSLPTPRMNPAIDLKKSGMSDLDENNDTIIRLNYPSKNFLPFEFKNSKEISDINLDVIHRYKQEIEALNIENASLKKALQQLRAQSPTLPPSSPTKRSFKKSLTNVKIRSRKIT